MKTRIIAMVAAAILISTIMVAASDTQDTKKQVKLKKGYVLIEKSGPEMGPVIFFHRRHKGHAINDKKCKTCHHVGKWKQSCSEAGCHNDPEKDIEGQRIHATCLERCHVANPSGKSPTECEECHK